MLFLSEVKKSFQQSKCGNEKKEQDESGTWTQHCLASVGICGNTRQKMNKEHAYMFIHLWVTFISRRGGKLTFAFLIKKWENRKSNLLSFYAFEKQELANKNGKRKTEISYETRNFRKLIDEYWFWSKVHLHIEMLIVASNEIRWDYSISWSFSCQPNWLVIIKIWSDELWQNGKDKVLPSKSKARNYCLF